MKFDSKITLTAKDVEAIIIAHLQAQDRHGLKFKSVYFNVDGGGRNDYGGYDAARLTQVTVNVEMELE
jgi:hypothetical protein